MSIDKEVIKLTEDFIQQNNLNSSNFPLEMETLIEGLGIAVIKHDFDKDISGVLSINGISKSIGVNRTESPKRQRFTLAHELGHYILHQDKSNLFMDSILFRKASEGYTKKEEKIEKEANYFAANILMPATRIKHELYNMHIDFIEDEDINKLAETFGVSVSAMTYRLINLGLIRGY